MRLYGALQDSSHDWRMLFPRAVGAGAATGFFGATDTNRIDHGVSLNTSGFFDLVSFHSVGSLLKTYSNGSQSDASTIAVTNPPNIEFYAFAFNNAGTPTGYLDSILSFMFFGGEMIDAQIVNLHDHILTFQQAMSRAS
ncbi:hypothetical protein Pse7367_2052 [Thalassoporum mexicanum PCC 7367]|uniref:hypothetical protein n=1 Tax=Thalassoporum mexicanum TaxID=3457544 RepID=UPI00029FC751|nr:hypothetical protein [Pseudanabaena sp. PCC 7367]AFY70320.1 hypothetical protein Pse7367_2052 [Pseudanabaena sp. PCC 7367]